MGEQIIGPLLDEVPEVGTIVYVKRHRFFDTPVGVAPKVCQIPLTVIGVDRRNRKRLCLLAEKDEDDAYTTTELLGCLDKTDEDRYHKGIKLFSKLTEKRLGRRFILLMYHECYGAVGESTIDEKEGWE
jgi:hypothetical protein